MLAGIIVLIVARDYPLVGHDFRYYIPRLLDTDLHVRINGMAVQWYTPTFGGGLPAFANPQHLQYSALQLLTYFVNPWIAVLVTLFAVSVAGFFGMYVFLRRRLQLDAPASTLGAVFFLGNGFHIEHAIVGHVGFMLFPLSAVLLAVLTDRRRPIAGAACAVALVLAAMLFQASVYLIILTSVSLCLTLPLVYLIDRSRIALSRVLAIAAAGLMLFVLICTSKLYAGFALARLFPREIFDVHDAGLLQALAGVAAQLAGVMTIVPVLALAGLDVTRVAGVLSRLVGSPPHIALWELDTGLSPVLLLVLLVAGGAGLVRLARYGLPRLTVKQKRAILALGIMTWLVIEAAIADGFVYPYLKELPLLRSLHVNPRMTAVFILPLSIAGAAAVARWTWVPRYRVLCTTAIAIAIVCPLAFLLLPADSHLRTFDATMSVADAARIRAGERLPVTGIANVSDADALSLGASSYRPYEPMFGYSLETFATETHLGHIREVAGGYFNMTHPASLVFPDVNGLRPFERIHATDGDRLDAFVQRRQPDWGLPPLLTALNWLAVASVAGAVVGAGLLR
jgi:hypothetical protein